MPLVLFNLLKKAFNTLFHTKNQAWTFCAQMVRLLSGFAFIALLARNFSSELLGTWYVFVSLFGVASLVELGLGQVIGRHAAYLKADLDLGRISNTDFLKFAKVGEVFYLFLTSTVGLFAFQLGRIWLGLSDNKQDVSGSSLTPLSISNEWSVLTAWLIYVCAGMLTLFGAYYSAILNGVGQMWQTQRAAIFSAGISIMVLMTLLVLPANLLIPATATFLSQLMIVLLLRTKVYRLDILLAAKTSNIPATIDIWNTLRNISFDAAKMLLIMISYQILTNGFVLVLSTFLQQKEVGSYGLTMQLVGIVLSLSMIWSQSNFFEIASTRQGNDTDALRRIFFSGLKRALGVASLGLASILLFADPLLSLMQSKTSVLEAPLIIVVLAAVLVEFGCTQFSQLLIARGDLRVAYLSLLASSSICASTTLLLYNGYSLALAFAMRMLLFSVFIGIPVCLLSFNMLRFQKSQQGANLEAT